MEKSVLPFSTKWFCRFIPGSYLSVSKGKNSWDSQLEQPVGLFPHHLLPSGFLYFTSKLYFRFEVNHGLKSVTEAMLWPKALLCSLLADWALCTVEEEGFFKLCHLCLPRRDVTCSSTKAIEDIRRNMVICSK